MTKKPFLACILSKPSRGMSQKSILAVLRKPFLAISWRHASSSQCLGNRLAMTQKHYLALAQKLLGNVSETSWQCLRNLMAMFQKPHGNVSESVGNLSWKYLCKYFGKVSDNATETSLGHILEIYLGSISEIFVGNISQKPFPNLLYWQCFGNQVG